MLKIVSRIVYSAPPPLSCDFDTGTYRGPANQVTATSGPTQGQKVNGVFEQMLFSFTAEGGDIYHWSATQTGSVDYSVTFTNGNTRSGVTPLNEQLAQIAGGGGNAAVFNDNPGLQTTTPAGTIQSATAVWEFTLQASVTSNGQKANCPPVTWGAVETWNTVNGKLVVTGFAFVEDQP